MILTSKQIRQIRNAELSSAELHRLNKIARSASDHEAISLIMWGLLELDRRAMPDQTLKAIDDFFTGVTGNRKR